MTQKVVYNSLILLHNIKFNLNYYFFTLNMNCLFIIIKNINKSNYNINNIYKMIKLNFLSILYVKIYILSNFIIFNLC
jgi:hypothetical protein